MGYRRQGFPNSIIHPGRATYNLSENFFLVKIDYSLGIQMGRGSIFISLEKKSIQELIVTNWLN